VEAEGTVLRRTSGQTIGQIPGGGSVVLSNLPAVASLVLNARQADGMGRTPPRTRAEIVLRELVTASPVTTISLFDEPLDPYRGGYGDPSQGNTLLAVGDALIAVVRDRLFVVKIPAADAGKFPVPLHFTADQAIAVIDPGKALTYPVKIVGSQTAIELAVARETPGVDVDKAKQTLSIAAGPLQQQAAAMLAALDPPGGVSGLPGGKGLAAYRMQAGPRFKQLAGHDPTGIPACIILPLVARDASMQTASMNLPVLIDVPADLVQAEADKLRTKPGVSNLSTPPNPAASAGDVDQRVAELERKVQTLETKIDLMLQLMNQGARPAPTTRPY
jgi:hypothetical protein